MLEMKSISKTFGQVSVLHDISFSVKSGEVHALLGVNGAGKSTLMKILSGDYSKDSGQIILDGKEVLISSPSDAKYAGIGIVVQEVDTALVPSLSIAENLVIDTYTKGSKFSIISKRSTKGHAQEILDEINVELNVNKLVSQCSLAEKQMLLIARAVSSNVKYLILDEPTAPLSKHETEKLFQVINRLKKNNVGIIYISHRLPEIKEITDRLTIMRDGRVISVKETKHTEMDEIITNMLGDQVQHLTRPFQKFTEKPLLEVTSLQVARTGKTVNLTVHEGEVLGVAGLVGAGKTETARALFGADRSKGDWKISGSDKVIRSTHEAIANGICLVPEERRKEGILVDLTVKDNLTLPFLQFFSKLGLVNRAKEATFANKQIDSLAIKTNSPNTKLRSLSGGNQQKVSIGKWINDNSKVFLFDEPTKGIDIGAKKEVFKLITSLAEEGKGILYFTSEFEELLEIADRILIMYDGEIVASLKNEEASYELLMKAATGGLTDEANS